MKTLKHTPGDWELDTTGVIYGPPADNNESSSFVADVCKDFLALNMTERERANGILIAAAPKLLKSLEALLYLGERMELEMGEIDPVVEAARQAIKQATQ